MLSKLHKTHVCPYLIIFLNLNQKNTESNDLFLNYLKMLLNCPNLCFHIVSTK